MWLVPFVLAADPALPPKVELRWRRGLATLKVQAPPGEHASPDAPTSLRVKPGVGSQELSIETFGPLDGVRLPMAEPGAVEVVARLAFCEDDSGFCRMITVQGSGTLTQKTPISLVVAPTPRSAASTTSPAATPAAGPVRLYDFGAVWCPPCNLMAAEVLENPEHAGALAGLELVAIDVDRPESWPLKDQYAVGGYPTLVAVTADGAEVDRLVGYPGAEATLAWLKVLPALPPIHTFLGPQAPALSGLEAAAAARRLAEAEQNEAANRYIALAGSAGEGVDLRIARLLMTPNPEDAAWLFAHAPPGDWVFAALKASPPLRAELGRLLGEATPAQAADYLAMAAEGAEPETRRALQAAALAVLRAAQTGDLHQDKGHQVFLADLYAETGQIDEAAAVLDRADAAFPDELTFVYAKARMLYDAGRLADAEAAARVAHSRSWGDQRYRTAMLWAKTLRELGRVPEAQAVLDAVLAELPVPAADVEVRTHRYRRQTEEMRAALVAAK